MNLAIPSPGNEIGYRSLAQILTAVGTIMAIISLITAAVLYSGFGQNTIESIIYTAIGITIAFLTAVLLPVSGFIWRANYAPLATVVFLFWLAALWFEFSSHLGFMAFSQAHRERAEFAGSVVARQAQSDLDAAQTDLKALSRYSNVDIASRQAELSAIDAQIQQTQDKLNRCPKNYFKNCIDPTTAELAELRAKRAPIAAEIDGFNRYQGAQSAKSDALSALSGSGEAAAAIADGNGTIHPLFIEQAQMFGGQPAAQKSSFLVATALFMTVGTALVWFLAGVLGAIGRDQEQLALANSPAPALPNSQYDALATVLGTVLQGIQRNDTPVPRLAAPAEPEQAPAQIPQQELQQFDCTACGVTTTIPQDKPVNFCPACGESYGESLEEAGEAPEEAPNESSPRPKKLRQRGTGDTDVNPPNNRRFLEATEALLSGEVEPTKRQLQFWSRDRWGAMLGATVVNAWQMEWERQGFIEKVSATNGQETYQRRVQEEANAA